MHARTHTTPNMYMTQTSWLIDVESLTHASLHTCTHACTDTRMHVHTDMHSINQSLTLTHLIYTHTYTTPYTYYTLLYRYRQTDRQTDAPQIIWVDTRQMMQLAEGWQDQRWCQAQKYKSSSNGTTFSSKLMRDYKQNKISISVYIYIYIYIWITQ